MTHVPDSQGTQFSALTTERVSRLTEQVAVVTSRLDTGNERFNRMALTEQEMRATMASQAQLVSRLMLETSELRRLVAELSNDVREGGRTAARSTEEHLALRVVQTDHAKSLNQIGEQMLVDNKPINDHVTTLTRDYHDWKTRLQVVLFIVTPIATLSTAIALDSVRRWLWP